MCSCFVSAVIQLQRAGYHNTLLVADAYARLLWILIGQSKRKYIYIFLFNFQIHIAQMYLHLPYFSLYSTVSVCKLISYVEMVTALASVINLAAVSVER